MSLASIQPILSVEKHPNADLLDVVQVMGYKCIVKRDTWKVNDLCVFIEPDTVLPEKLWSAIYRAKSGRVKAIRLRGVWSMGIVETVINVGYEGEITAGLDIAEAIGVTKYDPPLPQDLNASGPYGYGIPRTDESRWQSVRDLPFGEKVDVTLKIDGSSLTSICIFPPRPEGCTLVEEPDPQPVLAVGGRSFLYKMDCDNNYTRNARAFNVLEKLEKFCRDHGNVSLAIRAESYGGGIQKSSVNPHSKLPLSLAFYSVWLVDERKYANKGHPLYIHNIAEEIGLPTVALIEKDVVLTPALIRKYDEELEMVNGVSFEGVVIQYANGSFKVINKSFDSKK